MTMTTAYGEAGPETQEAFNTFRSQQSAHQSLISRAAPSVLVVRDDIVCFRPRYNALGELPPEDTHAVGEPLPGPTRREGANDVGGAFMPEACWFSYVNNAPAGSIHIIDNGAQQIPGPTEAEPTEAAKRAHRANVTRSTREPILNVLSSWAGPPLAAVAFFCHGDASWMQLGFDLGTIGTLAEVLATKAAPDVRIVLYACLTGAGLEEEADARAHRHTVAEQPAGAGGIAFTLRDLLVASKPGVSVIGHTTSAHATRNPRVRRFEGPAGSPGTWIVPPASRREEGALLWDRWTETLANPFSTYRPSTLLWRFPFMTDAQVRAYLEHIYEIAPPPPPRSSRRSRHREE